MAARRLIIDGNRVGRGLRAPVLNGWALIGQVELHEKGAELQLEGGLANHFLDLGGLGVRDLKRRGDEAPILAGPTMKLDGPASIYRRRALSRALDAEDRLHRPELVLELPYGADCDHPGALAAAAHDGGEALLVVCDTPASYRLGGGAVLTDLFPWPV